MDPVPSTSQGATTSAESSLKHMHAHDVAAFGLSCDLSGLNLPTKQDILRYFFFLAERAKIESKMYSYKTFTPYVTDKLIEIWSTLNIEILLTNNIGKKLNAFLDKYQTALKNKAKGSTFVEFVQSTKELFYIGKCKCDLKVALCSCGLIPEHLKEFMLDQHNDRKLTIPEHVPVIEEQVSTITTIQTTEGSPDETYVPGEDMDIDDELNAHAVGAQGFPPTVRRPYTPRYDALNFAMM